MTSHSKFTATSMVSRPLQRPREMDGLWPLKPVRLKLKLHAKPSLVVKGTRLRLRNSVYYKLIRYFTCLPDNSNNLVGKPALGAAPTSTSATASRSLSRTKKSTDGKVHDGALPTEASARSGSSEDEAKSKAKSKDRSQSRKRGSFFGAILGRKEEHDEKKEIKKEEKAEEKALKDEIRKEEKAEKKQEKEERNLEKQLEKEEKQLEKEEKKEAKDTKADEPAPLDAAAIGTSRNTFRKSLLTVYSLPCNR